MTAPTTTDEEMEALIEEMERAQAMTLYYALSGPVQDALLAWAECPSSPFLSARVLEALADEGAPV